MKAKIDFVTNSSSTAFIISNNTNHKKTLVDFVRENPQLVQEFVEIYGYKEEEFNQVNLIKSAEENNLYFKPGERKYCIFGDEQGTIVGYVFDYILRDGGKSKSFSWKFEEHLR